MLVEPHHVRKFSDHLASGLEAADGTKGWLTILTEASEKQDHEHLRNALKDVVSAVAHGHSLSSALSKHPDVFSARFLAAVQQGEKAGLLDETLRQFATEELEAV